MIGTKSVALSNKKMRSKKNREKRREIGKTHITVQISSTSRSHFICGLIELKFGGKV